MKASYLCGIIYKKGATSTDAGTCFWLPFVSSIAKFRTQKAVLKINKTKEKNKLAP